MKIRKTILKVLGVLIIALLLLVLWISNGSQSNRYPIPTNIDKSNFKIYTATDSLSPLKLKHFISEPSEINVSSAIVYGDKEAIVFVAQGTKSAANRLADEIEKTNCKLKYVYLSHPHLDHSQGASILAKRFPEAKFIAEPKVAKLQQLRMEADDEMATKRYGENAAVPSVAFESFDNDKLMIEGREIQLWHDQVGDIGIGYLDEPHTVVYIPDLKALLPNDICYFGGHMFLGGTTTESRAQWKAQIRNYMKMDLEVVIPGHIPRTWQDKITAKGVLNHSLNYIEDYEKALNSSTSSDEVIEKMLQKYPNLGHTSALYLGSYINFGETHRLLFNPRLEKVASWLPESLLKSINKKMFDNKKKAANF